MPAKLAAQGLRPVYHGNRIVDRIYAGSKLVYDEFVPTGVLLDNSEYLERDTGLDGAVDDNEFTFSAWINPTADVGFNEQTILAFSGPAFASPNFKIVRSTSNVIEVYNWNGVAQNVRYRTSQAVLAADGWAHILVSQVSTGVMSIYINDVVAPLAVATGSTANLDFTPASGGSFNIGAARFNSGIRSRFFPGSISEIYFDIGTYTDLSVEANRRKFITSDGRPANLGRSGEKPTGTAPILYLGRYPYSAWKDNRGTGGALTEVGTITQEPTIPSVTL